MVEAAIVVVEMQKCDKIQTLTSNLKLELAHVHISLFAFGALGKQLTLGAQYRCASTTTSLLSLPFFPLAA